MAPEDSEPGPSGAPPAPRPRPKRSQVVRACDWCRKHRVKCDSHYPCSNCVNRGGECSNEAMRASTLPLAHREIDRLRSRVRELELELREERGRVVVDAEHFRLAAAASSLSPPELLGVASEYGEPAGPTKLWGGIHMSTARSPHKTWYGPSSLFYFIGRINGFLNSTAPQSHSEDQILLNSSSRILHEPTATISDEPPSNQSAAEDAAAKETYLSPTQEQYFLDLFWQSYHTSLYPILDEAEFKQHYQSLWTVSGRVRKPSALVDIVVAMCMQYGMSMLLAVKQHIMVDNTDATIAGRWHYRRSQTLLARELESPTVSTLQCQLLYCVYLCCGSFQNMADSACGLAVRAAYMLGLHIEPPQAMPQREQEMRRRLWWALYVLDSKIGMKLGRPFLLSHSSVTPTLPGDSVQVAMQSGSSFAPLGDNITWLSFNLHHSKLFRAARIVHTAFYDRDPAVREGLTIWDDQEALGSHAEFIRPYMKGLDEWASGVPAALKTNRQNNGQPFSTDGTALEIEQFAPLWIQRQRLLLELMYHHLNVNLYRPFISFTPGPTSATEEAAIKCAMHTITVTNMVHQVLSTTTILAGWHEAFQIQWNSAITLIGFVLAYPQAPLTTQVRNAIDLSVAIFDMFSDSFAVAASAAKIMRDLGAKVDFLQQQEQGMAKMLDNVLVMPDSTVSKTWDGTLSFDDLNAASMQDVFSMAFAVDEWSNTDSLWPGMDHILPPEHVVG
ncbi:hypothetical protein AK830_g3983 [Neonectria ditissima]|uniref:Zn(2)-C6 fungal-type domain-containing protein n=1 Tax=Neonectria ditissima TaxID=78410 RepID=A0A0P7AX56_9HYPO|nr:hypothetical protein AK830_g3983 [Neonectria ditissima]